jgi:hypothetical protein
MVRMSFDYIDSAPRHYLLGYMEDVDFARYKWTHFVRDHRLTFQMELELELLVSCHPSGTLAMVLGSFESQEGLREVKQVLLDLCRRNLSL